MPKAQIKPKAAILKTQTIEDLCFGFSEVWALFGFWFLCFVSFLKNFLQVPSSKFQVPRSRGIALLLVVVLLSALLSISFGIFAVVFGQILISGEIADSFIALYAADEGIERTLYRDRIQQVIADGYIEEASAASGGCYAVSVAKSGGNTTVTISGQYRCGDNQTRVIKRGFRVRY